MSRENINDRRDEVYMLLNDILSNGKFNSSLIKKIAQEFGCSYAAIIADVHFLNGSTKSTEQPTYSDRKERG